MTATNWRKFNHSNDIQRYIFKTLLLLLLISVLLNYRCPIYAGNIELEVVGDKYEVNAASYGFDEENATLAIQSAIRSGASKVIVPNVGKPWIIDSIFLESNQEIVFEEGVTVVARKGGFKNKNDSLFEAVNKENIILRGYGAKWLMHKNDYRGSTYEKSEWRHCLTLRGCSNVTVAGLHMASSGGDGIYIGRGHGSEGRIACNDIKI